LDQLVTDAVKRLKPEGIWILSKALSDGGAFPRTLILRYDGPEGTMTQVLWRTNRGYNIRSEEYYRDDKLIKYHVII
jgi:hypothetical protein